MHLPKFAHLMWDSNSESPLKSINFMSPFFREDFFGAGGGGGWGSGGVGGLLNYQSSGGGPQWGQLDIKGYFKADWGRNF